MNGRGLFGRGRLEFFHLESAVSHSWRRGTPLERLRASGCDDYALMLLAALTMFRGESEAFGTRRIGNLSGKFYIALEELPTVKKAPQATSRDNAPEWKGFLEYRLTAEELEDLDSWQPDAAEVFEELHRFLVDGYSFTVTWSFRTEQACFSLRDISPERKTAGYCMTTFDANCMLAIKAGVFKQTLVLKGDWTPLLSAGKAVRRG